MKPRHTPFQLSFPARAFNFWDASPVWKRAVRLPAPGLYYLWLLMSTGARSGFLSYELDGGESPMGARARMYFPPHLAHHWVFMTTGTLGDVLK